MSPETDLPAPPPEAAPDPAREARAAVLARLDAAKVAADVAETAYRAEAARRTEELARDRAHAWRRADLMRSLATALDGIGDAEMAVAAGQALLRARLGWSDDSEARAEVLVRFAPVAVALFEMESETAPQTALAAFEDWYATTRQSAFWYLFEHYLPDTPLVDF
ncbi:hypothetical protein [Xanthobacter sp. YC-JY1]|uniref:hypothetical protein n=1 Tax=Xanthobacter sp. YC-JY1 TaxID=2419844 RepID=UPI001F359307|nr:hypothetical protein [Xanthobacter sp. YC-JY1]UJX43915.1 hypothetical protein D7006_03620 [Xanthobacter sp. YC-JY1]